MIFHQRPSGILVAGQPEPPKPPDPPPLPTFGPIEIRDPEMRKRTIELIGKLWYSIGLNRPSKRILPGPWHESDAYEERYRLYRLFGESLLGDDCPDGEQLC